MSKTLMILGGGKNEVSAALKARRMGVKTVVVDMKPSAPALQFADVAVVAKTRDFGEYIDIGKSNKIDGVMTVSVDSLVRVISRVAEALGLAGIPSRAAEIATDKYLTRELCRQHGLPSVGYFRASSLKEARIKLDGMKFPLVIKPTDRAGSRGVFKLNKAEDLEKFFHVSAEASRDGNVLIEEFIEGPDSTVDSITVNGKTHILGVSDKTVVETPNLIAMDLTFPPSYSEEILNKVKTLVSKLIETAGIKNSACHTEIIVHKAEPRIIEFGARAGGALIPSDILPHICGFDPIEKYILLALGEDVRIPYTRPRTGAALRFFGAPAGKLKKIRGIEDAMKVKGLHRLEFVVREGDILKPPSEGNERYGFAITWGKDRRDAVRIADEIENLVKFDVEKVYDEAGVKR